MTVPGWTGVSSLTLGVGGLLLSLLFLRTPGPKVQVTTAPSSWARLGSGALLHCRFTVEGPVALDSLRVQWYLGEVKVAWYDRGRSQAQSGSSLPSEKELQSGDASLSLVTVTPWDKGTYKCVVWHGEHHHQGETTLHLLAAPTVSIPRQPAVVGMKTSLLCHIRGFLPKDVDVVWLRDGQVLKDSSRSSPQMNPDGTFDLTLTYTFTPARSDASSVFSCHVHHAALGQPLQEDVPLVILDAPTISIQRQQGIVDAETSLLCHVGGFFPKDVDVAWLRDGQVLQGSTQSSPKRNQDGTFSLTLTYTFTPARSDAGSIFSCHVHHAALGHPLRANISLNILVQSTDVDQTRRLIIVIIIIAGTVVIIIISHHINRKKDCRLCSPDRGEGSQLQDPVPGQPVTVQSFISGSYPRQLVMAWLGKRARKKEPRPLQNSDAHSVLIPVPSWAMDGKS
ncbi:natural cytotoxicity triggering receptor 3 ligand 1-like [Alligator sinensis]|uniref:Natural cytotoxicity triggering receptor 3 ligand 1-like n=1 Tax=Alligator sinensis TaxID=38654 RepID=A0A3Q0FX38_ALLSI|nr:natural cytotoxicity triggering receptor 3 ligand 1-like [Alligator sinensis]